MVATRVAFATATTALLSGVEYLRPPIGEPLVACTSYFVPVLWQEIVTYRTRSVDVHREA